MSAAQQLKTAPVLNLDAMNKESEERGTAIDNGASAEYINESIQWADDQIALMQSGYTDDMKTDQRVKVIKSLKDLKRFAITKSPEQFPVGSTLTNGLRVAFGNLRKIILRMGDTPDDEKEILDLIKSFYLLSTAHMLDVYMASESRKEFNKNYEVNQKFFGIKYVASKHEKLKELMDLYYEVQGKNYDRLFNSGKLHEARVGGLLTKMRVNLEAGHYKGPVAENVKAILDARQ